MNRPHRAGLRFVRWMLSLSLLAAGWLLLGCNSNDPVNPSPTPEPVAPEIDSLSIPSFWVYDSPHYRTLRVRLGLPEDLSNAVAQRDIIAPAVILQFSPLDGASEDFELELFDDGGGRSLESPHSFVDERSGDLIPLDLTYSLRINARFALSEGDYSLTVIAGWSLPISPEPSITFLADTLRVEVNSPPEITSFEHADSLHAGFEPQVWTAFVSDPDEAGGDMVQQVEMHLLRDGSAIRNLLLAPDGDNEWIFSLSASFAAGLPTSAYTVRLIASDRFDQPAEPFEDLVWIENTAPMLSNLVAPDTVYRPEGDDPPDNLYDMYVDVEDLQGQGDVQRVDYILIDPRGDIWQNQDLFVFNDLGLGADQVAGDGVWSHRFGVQSSVSNFGTYTFIFTGHDRANNDSENLVKEIVLPNTGGKQ